MLLDFVRMKCEHTGKNIRNLTMDIIEKLDIRERFIELLTVMRRI
jgi:hypothetical protein